MAAPIDVKPDKLRIVHVFRAPLGGLFRHVVDLAAEQSARGHDVGMFFDSGADSERVRTALASIPGGLKLGVETTPIDRNPGVSDFAAMARFVAWLRKVGPDVVHGHGSKGGVYARFSRVVGAQRGAIRAYTPHGGSFNFQPGSGRHRAYMLAEKLAAPLTDVFLFESAYIAGRFDAFVGARNGARRVVANGIGPAELTPTTPNDDAADLLYVGELRAAKGIDTLLDAIARIGRERGVVPRAVLVGSGPDEAMLTERARRLGVADHVTFPGPMPIRRAFALGRLLVVPSRAESMPYVVLEGAGAGVPMIATNVGGIPEIFGPFRDRLGPPDDVADLSARIAGALATPPETRIAQAAELAAHVAANFSIETMVNSVMAGYAEAMGRRPAAAGAPIAAIPTHN